MTDCKECKGVGAHVANGRMVQCLECADVDFVDTKEMKDLHLAIAARLPAYVFPNAYDDNPRSRKALSVDSGRFKVRGIHVDLHDLVKIVNRLWTVTTKNAEQAVPVKLDVVAFSGYATSKGQMLTTMTVEWSTIR
jgi:hypothetical protein